MISKSISSICCEDPSLIEGYAEAIADERNMWECHHRLEIVDGEVTSGQDLIRRGLYYRRPADELVFMLRSDHKRLHALIERRFNSRKHPQSHQPVIQMDLDGKKIKKWKTIYEAEKKLGLLHILRCCKGQRRTVGGFKWRFASR